VCVSSNAQHNLISSIGCSGVVINQFQTNTAGIRNNKKVEVAVNKIKQETFAS
jgi:hypothetical protein